MKAARQGLLIALALAAAGCGDPGYTINGHVRTASDACGKVQGDVYVSGPPVAGAAVHLRCPQRQSTIAKTDATGHFEFVTLGFLEAGCTVVVEKEGYRPQRFAIDEICAYRPFGGTHCAITGIQAELTPAR